MPANRTSSLVGREGLGGPYFLLTFLHPEIAREARPGQFVMIKAGLSAEPPLRRPFSILDAEPRARDVHAVRQGDRPGHRARSATLPTGRRRAVPGPARPPVHRPARGHRGADGGRRLRHRALQLPRRGAARAGARARASSTAGARRPTCRCASRFARARACRVAATEDGSLGATAASRSRSRPTSTRRAAAPRLYACGPDAMMHAVARIAAARGLPAEVSLDPWMGCGVGTCLGCVVKIQRARATRAEVPLRLHRGARVRRGARSSGRARGVARARDGRGRPMREGERA